MKNQIGAVFTDILLIAEAFGQGPDNDLLIPLLDTAASNYDSIGKGNEFLKNKTVINQVRFTMRGKNKVNIQWLLFCIVHNPGKITTFGNLSMA